MAFPMVSIIHCVIYKYKCVYLFAIIKSIVSVILELSETQRELQDLARKFSREEMLPKAAYYDQNEEFPWDVVKKAHAVGLLNTAVPQAFGIVSDLIF